MLDDQPLSQLLCCTTCGDKAFGELVPAVKAGDSRRAEDLDTCTWLPDKQPHKQNKSWLHGNQLSQISHGFQSLLHPCTAAKGSGQKSISCSFRNGSRNLNLMFNHLNNHRLFDSVITGQNHHFLPIFQPPVNQRLSSAP